MMQPWQLSPLQQLPVKLKTWMGLLRIPVHQNKNPSHAPKSPKVSNRRKKLQEVNGNLWVFMEKKQIGSFTASFFCVERRDYSLF
jgi:hypothetical protein